MGVMANLGYGFALVLAIEVIVTVSNVGTSYLFPSGQTWQEFVSGKVGQ